VSVGISGPVGYQLPPKDLVLTISLADSAMRDLSSWVLTYKTISRDNSWSIAFRDVEGSTNGTIVVKATGGPYQGQAVAPIVNDPTAHMSPSRGARSSITNAK
jgi:hypothetical protein